MAREKLRSEKREVAWQLGLRAARLTMGCRWPFHVLHAAHAGRDGEQGHAFQAPWRISAVCCCISPEPSPLFSIRIRARLDHM